MAVATVEYVKAASRLCGKTRDVLHVVNKAALLSAPQSITSHLRPQSDSGVSSMLTGKLRVLYKSCILTSLKIYFKLCILLGEGSRRRAMNDSWMKRIQLFGSIGTIGVGLNLSVSSCYPTLWRRMVNAVQTGAAQVGGELSLGPSKVHSALSFPIVVPAHSYLHQKSPVTMQTCNHCFCIIRHSLSFSQEVTTRFSGDDYAPMISSA